MFTANFINRPCPPTPTTYLFAKVILNQGLGRRVVKNHKLSSVTGCFTFSFCMDTCPKYKLFNSFKILSLMTLTWRESLVNLQKLRRKPKIHDWLLYSKPEWFHGLYGYWRAYSPHTMNSCYTARKKDCFMGKKRKRELRLTSKRKRSLLNTFFLCVLEWLSSIAQQMKPAPVNRQKNFKHLISKYENNETNISHLQHYNQKSLKIFSITMKVIYTNKCLKISKVPPQ